MRTSQTKLSLLFALCLVSVGSALSATPALAARGHVFGKSFGEKGTAPGQLEEPAGVAVNESKGEPASGDVYVADKAENRVEVFGEEGKYKFQFTGPSATGTGVLSAATGTGKITEGSEIVEGVVTSTGTFAAGQEISGPGISPGTTIGEYEPVLDILVLSVPVEVGAGTGVSVHLTASSRVVTGAAASAGAFTVGEEIEGEGVPAGTTIENVVGSTLELSQPVTKAGEPVGEPVALKAHQSFAAPEGIAVDNACALHTPELTESSSPTCHEYDASGGDVYVVSGGVVDKFTPAGAYIGQLTVPAESGAITGVAVDSHGNVWVGQAISASEFTDAEPNELSTSVPDKLPFDDEPGFTVDGEDDIYVHGHGDEHQVAKFSSAGVLLDEKFDPEPSDWLGVELATGDVYVDHGTSLVRRAPDGTLLETLGAEAGAGKLTAGTGVAISSASETVYVAEPAAGEVFEYEPEPPRAPTVDSETASKVTGESATLEGELNPNSEPKESATEYHFEYIAEAAYQANVGAGEPPFKGAHTAPEPDGTVPADFNLHTLASVSVQGLVPGTVYHYRVLASNHCKPLEPSVVCKTEGVQSEGREVVRTFTTQTAGEFVLPDGRQWEMVSPPDKHGALIEPLDNEVAIQAAAAGGAIAYSTGSPTESDPRGYVTTVQVLSTRTSTGWTTNDVTLPHETAPGLPVGTGSEIRVFSEDLSQAIVQPFGTFIACTSTEGASQPCLSHEAEEQTPFLRDNTSGAYTPLVTHPGDDRAEHFEPFGEEAECAGSDPKQEICGPEFRDATPDLSHVVLESKVPLTKEGGNLYEWSAGKPDAERLESVTILPEDEGGSATGGFLGQHSKNVRNAISADGSRVFWATGGTTQPAPLYVRSLVPGHEESLRVAPDAEFEDASSDGSRVFYSEGGSLYECLIGEAGGRLACSTTDLGSGLMDTIPGVSDDGSWVYFVSSSAKPSTTLQGPEGVEGSPNLYLRHAGATRLVSTLSGADYPDWAGRGAGDISRLTSRVSSDGVWLAFMSQRGLTGYDTRDAVSGALDEEVYLYHAAADGGTGTLTCASCDPSGARPVGQEGELVSIGTGALVGGESWQGSSTWLAANVPAWEPYVLEKSVYQPRYLSDSGRVFFDAHDSLVPQAVNGNWDVYQYEPENVPAESRYACSPSSTSGSEAFKPGGAFQVPAEGGVPAHEVEEGPGCVALISSGESNRESAFLDADEGSGVGEHGAPGSEAGGEVFFLTTAKLSKQDTDNSLDVYDAHECTSASPCFPPAAEQPPSCATEASCKPAPESQPSIFGRSGSATFSGAGNPAPPPPAVVKKVTTKTVKCKKGFVKNKKGKCVRKSKSKKKKARKSNHGKGSK